MAILYGDTDTFLQGKQHGLDNDLHGVNNENDTIYGDAGSALHNFAIGGNDKLYGGSSDTGVNVSNVLYGDAYRMFEAANGGNDTLFGGTNANVTTCPRAM